MFAFARKERVLALYAVCCTALLLIGCGRESQQLVDPASDLQVSQAPTAVYFGDYNKLPRVRITVPLKLPIEHIVISIHAYVAWEGVDPDGDLECMAYKYLILPEASVPGGVWPPAAGTPHPWLPPLDQEGGADHGAPPIGYWSHWVPADCTYVSDLDLSAYAGTGQKVLAVVTARDEAGGVLPEERYWSYNGDRNWIKAVVIPAGPGVQFRIDGGPLGRRHSLNEQEYENEIAYIFPGTEVAFKFWALEDPLEGRLAKGYRYYYDDPGSPTWSSWSGVAPIRRPDCWPEWWVKFPPDGLPFAPSLGSHIFVAELRDLNYDVTRCEFRIEVVPGPGAAGGQLIYLVDDDRAKWLEVAYAGYEASSDSLWADILQGYTWEGYDTGINHSRVVPVSDVGDASTVIWLDDWDLEFPNTQLTYLCYELGNYLWPYVMAGGNLIVIGRDPVYSTMYWPEGTPHPSERIEQVSLDFRPKFNDCDSTWAYNFNREVFGIELMAVPDPAVAFTTLSPCEAGWDPVSTGLIPGVTGWPGMIDNAFYITQVRSDIPVHGLYSVVPVDGSGEPSGPPDCAGRLIGVWVPGDGTRGHAAYIGVPPWFFDHDQVKTMVRHLLTEFGEVPSP
ncbi:MAG: hypothetical protein WAW06_00865 [bacterium]